MSEHYTIWKDRNQPEGDYPWLFEGDEWGDTGSSATHADAIAATVGRTAP